MDMVILVFVDNLRTICGENSEITIPLHVGHGPLEQPELSPSYDKDNILAYGFELE
jgi:hypothetical protein